MAGAVMVKPHCSLHGGREAKSERDREGPNIPFKVTSQRSHFLLRVPAPSMESQAGDQAFSM
jgi:hypothetical protein